MGLVTIQRRCPFCDCISHLKVDNEANESYLNGTPAIIAFIDETRSHIRTIRTGVCKACDEVIYGTDEEEVHSAITY